jgi:SHS2 domain-containing protein
VTVRKPIARNRTADAPRWEHFAHDADIGVRGFGATVEEAFEQGALALTAVVCDPARVRAREESRLRCEAPDLELLFADWLNAIATEMATARRLFCEFEVEIAGDRLSGVARGEAVDVARHQPAVEIKGATYTCLRVAHERGVWLAQCVVDV